MYTPSLAILTLLLPALAAASATSSSSNKRSTLSRKVRSPPAPPAVRAPAHNHTFDERLNLSFDVGVCLALSAAVKIDAAVAGTSASVTAGVGACLCIDASADVGLLNPDDLLSVSADVDVVLQVEAGLLLNVGGTTAQEIAQSCQKPTQFPVARAKWPFTGTSCKAPPTLIPNSFHDFSKGCCGRTCKPGFFQENDLFGNPRCIPNCPADKPIRWKNQYGIKVCVPECKANEVRQPNGSCLPGCTPPKVMRPDGTCKDGCTTDQIQCNGGCYSKYSYTCPSGIVTPKRKRNIYECPVGKMSCPSVGSQGWECVDTQNDIESCGGCSDPSMPFAGPGVGTDCTAIAGTNAVSCHRGSCRIHSCQAGWSFVQNDTACAPVPSVQSSPQHQLTVMKQRS